MSELNRDLNIKSSPGIYIYYKRIDGPPRYVGRSDDDLRSRIRHGEKEYRYYQYSHCESPIDAYQKECSLWHRHRIYLDNQNHPDKPKGFTKSCPICGNSKT